jgi:hypothetical protein
MLNPGEAVFLIVRRSEADPNTYDVAVRRTKPASLGDTFDIGPIQVPLHELHDVTDVRTALEYGIRALRQHTQ